MKNITKCLLASILCGLMLPLSLVSCKDADSDDPDESSDTTTTATQKPDPEPEGDPNWVSAIFGGGPFVTGGEAMAHSMRMSGYNTLMLWSVHVHEDGDLVLNDIKVCEDGKFVGEESWSKAWKSLKDEGSTIKRIELSVGSWGGKDFQNIKALIERDGTGEDTVLYRNFMALIEASDADAVNYDDESCYDVASAVEFGKMCESMGMKVTLCPYMNMDFWVDVKEELGEELIDRIYLQCYGGGIYNKPADWEKAFGMKVIPGYWNIANTSEGKTAEEVGDLLKENKQYITGGFMWYYDEMQYNLNPNSVRDYSAAINEAGK